MLQARSKCLLFAAPIPSAAKRERSTPRALAHGGANREATYERWRSDLAIAAQTCQLTLPVVAKKQPELICKCGGFGSGPTIGRQASPSVRSCRRESHLWNDAAFRCRANEPAITPASIRPSVLGKHVRKRVWGDAVAAECKFGTNPFHKYDLTGEAARD